MARKRVHDSKLNQKSSPNGNFSKINNNNSSNEASEKSEDGGGPNLRRVKVCSEKEEQCLGWISSLNELESEINMESETFSPDKDVPEFCCNKI